ncbi:peptidoglycan editing factor PgeF, partial [Thiohalospira sp.]|uniref:peptidoglycan editing factor PgeF n=1 Tax=Thiohalospira sp. TaxID=3080549 RepID=UPI00397FD5F2
DPAAVAANRRSLVDALGLPGEPAWLEQVHGVTVADAAAGSGQRADASVAAAPGAVCAVLTADCLPVLLARSDGTVVAAAHAGWKGLAGGVLEAAVARLGPGRITAWLGPAIGPGAFEVGDEVRAAFVDPDPGAAACFHYRHGSLHADLYALARRRLFVAGVAAVHGGGRCTFTESERFYSYRRDGLTGRMATLVWREGGE